MHNWKKNYRAASWWLEWEDLDYPSLKTEKKFRKRADAFSKADINLAIIFGAHFRWDYIYNFERLHWLIKLIADIVHEKNILLFDHHSATLTHRPCDNSSSNEIYKNNRHHIPFYPSREMAEELCFEGHKLNDLRMLDIETGEPCFLERYTAETFCINNPGFREAYSAYLKLLLKTGIDGLMCDDVIFYPGWRGCGCQFCREIFRTEKAYDLPDFKDKSFWGNYRNPDFRYWVLRRFDSPPDFLKFVKKCLPPDFPLMSCCSGSVGKRRNAFALSAKSFSRSANHINLEICGEISSSKDMIPKHHADIMLSSAIATENKTRSINIFYAHHPEPAGYLWALNKFFRADCWFSTLPGRLDPETLIKNPLHKEEDIIKTFSFEKDRQEIFSAESAALSAVYFSFETQTLYGNSEEDYSLPWKNLVESLFLANVQFDIVSEISHAMKKHRVLILPETLCLSDMDMDRLLKFLRAGGTLFACGPVGSFDENCDLRQKPFLSRFGIDISSGEETEFDFFYNGEVLPRSKVLKFEEGSGILYLYPYSSVEPDLKKKLIRKLKTGTQFYPFSIKCPKNWKWKIYEKKGKYYIHFLNISYRVSIDRNVVYSNGKPVVKGLKFRNESPDLEITTRAPSASLYSHELRKVLRLKNRNGQIFFDSSAGPYFIIEL